MPDIASPLPEYVTNVACTVRVDGAPVRVPASTHLPAGVSPSEIERLLRFNVIRIHEPEPEPTPDPVEDTAPTADADTAKLTVKRSRKKPAVTPATDTEE